MPRFSWFGRGRSFNSTNTTSTTSRSDDDLPVVVVVVVDALAPSKQNNGFFRKPPKGCRLFLGICDMRVATFLLNVLLIFCVLILPLIQELPWQMAVATLCCALSGILGAWIFHHTLTWISIIGYVALLVYLVMRTAKPWLPWIHLVVMIPLILPLLFVESMLAVEMCQKKMTRSTYYGKSLINNNNPKNSSEQFLSNQGVDQVESVQQELERVSSRITDPVEDVVDATLETTGYLARQASGYLSMGSGDDGDSDDSYR